MTEADLPDSLVRTMRNSRRVVALTGAGVSAESGVPTFREAQTGLWELYDPMDLATPEAFERDPQLVWEWYEWRRKLVETAEPNAGHQALVELEDRLPNFSLVTQNVDGLHQRAGSRNVIELHGNITRSICSVERTTVDPGITELAPPPCPQCGASLRPDVVWFGEALPATAILDATEAARSCDVLFSIGTSSLVQPAASLPEAATRAGAIVVEINPDETPLSSRADYALRGPAGEVLPALVSAIYR
jgi:NAD-dependent deacetylase